MKKIVFLIVLMVAVIGLAFAAPTGSVSSATTVDASGEGTLGESVTLALTLGALSMNAGVVLTDIGPDGEVDLTGDIAVAFGDAVSVSTESPFEKACSVCMLSERSSLPPPKLNSPIIYSTVLR